MKIYFAGLLGFSLVGCASTQFVKKNYLPAEVEGKSLVLFPVFEKQIEITNMEDFFDDFENMSNNAGDFLKGEINNLSAQHFGKTFKNVVIENTNDSALGPLSSGNSEKISEKIGQDIFEIRVPKLEYLKSLNLNPKFVLVMDQIVFTRDLSNIQTSKMATGQGSFSAGGKYTPGTSTMVSVTGTKKAIGMGVNYVIYDYETRQVAGYGMAKGEKTFQFAMTQSDWYKAMDHAFVQITKFTPFYC